MTVPGVVNPKTSRVWWIAATGVSVVMKAGASENNTDHRFFMSISAQCVAFCSKLSMNICFFSSTTAPNPSCRAAETRVDLYRVDTRTPLLILRKRLVCLNHLGVQPLDLGKPARMPKMKNGDKQRNGFPHRFFAVKIGEIIRQQWPHAGQCSFQLRELLIHAPLPVAVPVLGRIEVGCAATFLMLVSAGVPSSLEKIHARGSRVSLVSGVAKIKEGNPVLALWLAHASKKLNRLEETIDLSAPYCVCCGIVTGLPGVCA